MNKGAKKGGFMGKILPEEHHRGPKASIEVYRILLRGSPQKKTSRNLLCTFEGSHAIQRLDL